ncbi:hypothetical protein O181_110149 [Austropuccinia psidii MF-1]|uniref:Uncharacterized protein n=1 Tax=Austropuccinia psidii MF-1 TaxID=1389203 RepID=A0A9Q3JXS4_9BASI|nr:hypothetical protein [Austropuccinia psidii MF-1]
MSQVGFIFASGPINFYPCSMPVKDVSEATQDIRKWEQAHSVAPVPIIGVTAHVLVGDREKCMNAGAL